LLDKLTVGKTPAPAAGKRPGHLLQLLHAGFLMPIVTPGRYFDQPVRHSSKRRSKVGGEPAAGSMSSGSSPGPCPAERARDIDMGRTPTDRQFSSRLDGISMSQFFNQQVSLFHDR
jgi:hypothetical protein